MRWVPSVGQVPGGKHSDSERYNNLPRATQYRDDRSMARAEEAMGTYQLPRLLGQEEVKFKARDKLDGALGSCSHWAPVSLVLFAASWKLSSSQAKDSFLQTECSRSPSPVAKYWHQMFFLHSLFCLAGPEHKERNHFRSFHGHEVLFLFPVRYIHSNKKPVVPPAMRVSQKPCSSHTTTVPQTRPFSFLLLAPTPHLISALCTSPARLAWPALSSPF